MVQRATGGAATNSVISLFASNTPAVINGGFTLSASARMVVSSNAWASNNLVTGSYRFTIDNSTRDIGVVWIPDDTNTYNLWSLITSTNVLFNTNISAAFPTTLQINGTNLGVGRQKINLIAGTNVAINGTNNTSSNSFDVRFNAASGGGEDTTKADKTNGVIYNPLLLGYAVTNINGTASTAIRSNLTLATNISVYVFDSGTGTNFTLTLLTNTLVADGSVFDVVLGSEGTNFLNLTPQSFSLGTADKINRATNWIITPGMTVSLQQVGTNWTIIRGQPNAAIGTIQAFDRDFVGVCPTLSSWWVGCNGQTITDASSPLNGRTLPLLNAEYHAGGRFLLGRLSSTGGGNSDAENHNHSAGTTIEVTETGGAGTFAWNAGTPSADNQGSRPPTYEILWVMRIK